MLKMLIIAAQGTGSVFHIVYLYINLSCTRDRCLVFVISSAVRSFGRYRKVGRRICRAVWLYSLWISVMYVPL